MTMTPQAFAGDKKAPMVSPLAKIEKQFILSNVAKFPSWLGSYHLTLMTILWSAGLIGFGYLARTDIHWLWGSSVMLFLQWFTDSFDGALGRHRDAGLVKWGFHMDHFLDFIFMWCVPVGYVFIVSGASVYLIFILAFVYSALMVSSFLDFAATNEFRITYLGFGPTEIRLAFIVLNTVLIACGPRFLDVILPYVVAVLAVGLCLIVYQAQKRIWQIDMEAKQEQGQ